MKARHHAGEPGCSRNGDVTTALDTMGGRGSCLLCVCAAGALLWAASARANVYATNLKLNNSCSNITCFAGEPVTISYILNERASAGVTVRILNGTNTVRTLNFSGDSLQASAGLSLLVWDSKDDHSNNVAPGTYGVSVAGAATGYTNWTQLTDDHSPYTYANDHAFGIALNRNRASPFYGRVFIANAAPGPQPGLTPGDAVGLLKLNADGSPADDGVFSNGGVAWSGAGFGPWKVDVSADDGVYVSDLGNGTNWGLYRFDSTVAANTALRVLRPDNCPSGARLSGPFIAGAGTHGQVWMADTRPQGSLGLLRWSLASDGTCLPNDPGLTVVGTGADLDVAPADVALDASGAIYTCQSITNLANPSQRVFQFAAYDPTTNNGAAQFASAWSVGGLDNTFASASGIAVSPDGVYVAVSFRGILFSFGNLKILGATNGATLAELDLGKGIGGEVYTQHDDTDCAWDAVGNVYYIDCWYGRWRAFSPPGPNQSTTEAPGKIIVQDTTLHAPEITGVSMVGAGIAIQFKGSASDTPSNFKVIGAFAVDGAYVPIAAGLDQLGSGLFLATVATNGPMQFYRIRR